MGLEPEPGRLPPGYPKEYQREEVLRDGRRVFLRPILPSDAPDRPHPDTGPAGKAAGGLAGQHQGF
jgi:hypothetical protein